jgi:hypothetical protein
MIPSLAGRTFRAVANSAHGRVGAETIMRFTADARVVVGEYSGGAIAVGHVLATRSGDGTSLELLYQGATTTGEIRAGRATARFTSVPEGALRMHLDWQWLTGEPATGQSEWVAV